MVVVAVVVRGVGWGTMPPCTTAAAAATTRNIDAGSCCSCCCSAVGAQLLLLLLGFGLGVGRPQQLVGAGMKLQTGQQQQGGHETQDM